MELWQTVATPQKVEKVLIYRTAPVCHSQICSKICVCLNVPFNDQTKGVNFPLGARCYALFDPFYLAWKLALIYVLVYIC